MQINENSQNDKLDMQTFELQKTALQFRKERRELWSRVILLSSAILGFSITIASNGRLFIGIAPLIRIGWALFLLNILCGLFLLKKESEFQQSQSLANLARAWDETEISIPPKTQIDKDKFVALLYLHDLRAIPPKELPFSEYAKNIYSKNKDTLTSWKMIKNPEKFYSYSHMRSINFASYLFYGSFVVAIIFLITSVVL